MLLLLTLYPKSFSEFYWWKWWYVVKLKINTILFFVSLFFIVGSLINSIKDEDDVWNHWIHWNCRFSLPKIICSLKTLDYFIRFDSIKHTMIIIMLLLLSLLSFFIASFNRKNEKWNFFQAKKKKNVWRLKSIIFKLDTIETFDILGCVCYSTHTHTHTLTSHFTKSNKICRVLICNW